MTTRIQPTPLSDAFFSDFNRESLHQTIIDRVKDKTGLVIDRQNDADLQAYMKGIYFNLVEDPFTNVKGQLDRMNAAVISQTLKDIIPNVLQRLVYLQDASGLPAPLNLPASTTTRGNKMPDNTKYAF